MNEAQIDNFLKVESQIQSTYKEISILSSKKPIDPVNKFKLKFINSIILEANEVLGSGYMPFFEEFKIFDEEDLPNNGDIVFMLSHYLESLEKFRCDNIKIGHDFSYYWMMDGKLSDKKTKMPKKY